jgi:hypothetical protein
MNFTPFDRKKHLYKSAAFIELVKDAIRFFNGTPVQPLPPIEAFLGAGVYALYYTGACEIYQKYASLNRLAYNYPIYVGKAVPKGWRQARVSDSPGKQSRELYNRLKEHGRSITAVSDLLLEDFTCRFMIFEEDSSDMIGTIEAALIKLNQPLWNVAVDGFGNHDPGRGRYAQAKSDWDVIHSGRAWAERCTGAHREQSSILANIESHLDRLGGGQ